MDPEQGTGTLTMARGDISPAQGEHPPRSPPQPAPRLGVGRALQPLDPQTLTLEGAEPRCCPWKQIMVQVMLPCQKRLLLHIRASITFTSSSCRVGDSFLRSLSRTPQPARLHCSPGSGSWLGSEMRPRVLLSFTVPSSCGRGAVSDLPPQAEGLAGSTPMPWVGG